MKSHMTITIDVKILLGALAVLAVAGLIAGIFGYQNPASVVIAQAVPTAPPTPLLVHAESGCTLVHNDLALLRAMYAVRGMTFPVTPDIMRARFFDAEGNGIVYDGWEVQTTGYWQSRASGTAAGEAGYREYLQAFQGALTETRGHLPSMVRPEGYAVPFPVGYHYSAHQWVHADWWMI